MTRFLTQRRGLVVTIAMSFVLGGCAATVKRGSDAAAPALPASASSRLVVNVDGSRTSTSHDDWPAFKEEWRVYFAEKAAAAGIPFQMQDGSPRPTGEAGTLLVAYVDDFRFIRPGTRSAVGVMAGNAFIESKLTFRDLKTGATWGTQDANTSSSAWEGVFSAMTNKQVEAIATEAVAHVKGAR